MSAGDLAIALSGFKFIENPRMVKGRMLRQPRSKKYRIRKKFANRPGNMAYSPAEGLFYMKAERIVIGHPAMIAALKAKIAASAASGNSTGRVSAPCMED